MFMHHAAAVTHWSHPALIMTERTTAYDAVPQCSAQSATSPAVPGPPLVASSALQDSLQEVEVLTDIRALVVDVDGLVGWLTPRDSHIVRFAELWGRTLAGGQRTLAKGVSRLRRLLQWRRGASDDPGSSGRRWGSQREAHQLSRMIFEMTQARDLGALSIASSALPPVVQALCRDARARRIPIILVSSLPPFLAQLLSTCLDVTHVVVVGHGYSADQGAAQLVANTKVREVLRLLAAMQIQLARTMVTGSANQPHDSLPLLRVLGARMLSAGTATPESSSAARSARV